MECNYLNEGCDGGWGIMNGLFLERANLVKESCAPYHAKTVGESCSNFKHCPAFAKIKDSYYVGGYNFLPSVQMIQKEMLMHGPLVTEFKCDEKFSLYHSGILMQTDSEIPE